MADSAVKPLRVVLADDSLLLREGVAKLLTSRGMAVIDQVGDGEALIRSIDRDQPDVAVVDIRMPPTGTDEGLRAAAELGERQPQVGVLVLSDYLEPRYAARLLEAGTPGRGYLLKETVTDLDAFFDAISRVAAGESVVDRAIVRRVVGELADPRPTRRPQRTRARDPRIDGRRAFECRYRRGLRVGGAHGRDPHRQHVRETDARSGPRRPPPGACCARVPGLAIAANADDRGCKNLDLYPTCIAARLQGLSDVSVMKSEHSNQVLANQG